MTFSRQSRIKCREIPTIERFCMLRRCNSDVAWATAPQARLTMKYEMATLYSSFAALRMAPRWSNQRQHPEGRTRINRLFWDVLRHFGETTVAKRRHFTIAAIVVATGVAGGCATTPADPGLTSDTPADVKKTAVAARAKARWDALIKPDMASAYAFLSPATRATMSLDAYKGKHNVGMYRAVTINSVNCEAERCTVNLRLTYDYQRFKGMTTPLVERWIITDGQAWFVEQG